MTTEHNYLFRAKNPRGNPVSDQVMATSAGEAMKKLRDSGYSEIELHTDDIFSRAGENPEWSARVRQTVRPDTLIRFRYSTRRQVKWLHILNAYRAIAWWL